MPRGGLPAARARRRGDRVPGARVPPGGQPRSRAALDRSCGAGRRSRAHGARRHRRTRRASRPMLEARGIPGDGNAAVRGRDGGRIIHPGRAPCLGGDSVPGSYWAVPSAAPCWWRTAACSRESDGKTSRSSSRFQSSGGTAPRAASSTRASPRRGLVGGAEAHRGLAGAGGLAGAEVGGEHHHGVGEVDLAAAAVGEPALLEHLQEEHLHVAVGLLDLVEHHHAGRAAPDRRR